MYVVAHMPASYATFFFFQAEDGIRDGHVTGVQTCALPIYELETAERQDRSGERGRAGTRVVHERIRSPLEWDANMRRRDRGQEGRAGKYGAGPSQPQQHERDSHPGSVAARRDTPGAKRRAAAADP